MKVLKLVKPRTLNPFTIVGKPIEKYDGSETESETTDHSEDPLSCSESSSFSSWDDDLDIPAIDSSFQEMAVECESTPSTRRSCLKRKGSQLRESIKETGEMELHLPMHDMPVRKRSCVSFKPSVKVRHIIPALKLARNEKEALWYQASEYIKIEKRCHLIAHKVLRGEDHNGKALCSRGLESLLNPMKRRGPKFEGWMAVFCEQGLQRQEGQFDDEKMSIMYRASSMESSTEAQRRGMMDEEDAQRYLFATREMCEQLMSMSEENI